MERPVEIRLPQFGMGMVDGTVIRWFKAVGDPVAVDEVVAEIEAAKATEELVAPATGVIGRIVVPEGATVDVHTILAVVVPVGADLAELRLEERYPDQVAAPPALPAPVAVPDWGPMPRTVDTQRRRPITPRARRLALDLGVDLDTVSGSGPDGRVTEDDVRAAQA